ncbi:hypothetical protein JYU34_010468 [Plutella xylostella]|uniref:Uncharacterized protein n=1 Tax=Plutella xylostella TaxID=51655 RepID=A0ABQ7QIG2_PLUXY|nr:hypothetical protein JYU34_010468 [Plutella xylostella]
MHPKKLDSVRMWIILIYLLLFGSKTQARCLDQYYDLESLVRPHQSKDGGDSPDFSMLDITTPRGFQSNLETRMSNMFGAQLQRQNPMGRVIELKDLMKYLSQNYNDIQTAEILDGNVTLRIDPNEPETERKLPEPLSRFYHPITAEEQEYLTEMFNKIYKLFIRPDDKIPEDLSKYYRPTPSQVKAATDFINYMVAQYKKRGPMDAWQHIEVVENYIKNHPEQVQDFVNFGKSEAVKVAQDDFQSQFGPDIEKVERLSKMLSDTHKVLSMQFSNDTIGADEEEDQGDFDSIKSLASDSFQGFSRELKRELRDISNYNTTSTGEPISRSMVPTSHSEMDPERRLFGLKTLKKKIKSKKKKKKTYLKIYKITMIIIKIILAIIRIIGVIYRLISYFFNIAMFTMFSIIGFFYPKMDYSHLFITRPESTMHDEKMSTPKPLEITHANVASSKVLLVTGYRITMSIVYLITSLDEMSKQSRWNIRKANFYTRSYRWILRHFSVWPYWLVKQGSYSNTHMLWTRRQYYNDADIPWLIQRLIFIVPPSEWDRDGRMENAFREQKQLGRFPMCLVTPCREHPESIDAQPWKGVWGLLGFKG